jgi:hypothetical protein
MIVEDGEEESLGDSGEREKKKEILIINPLFEP